MRGKGEAPVAGRRHYEEGKEGGQGGEESQPHAAFLPVVSRALCITCAARGSWVVRFRDDSNDARRRMFPLRGAPIRGQAQPFAQDAAIRHSDISLVLPLDTSVVSVWFKNSRAHQSFTWG